MKRSLATAIVITVIAISCISRNPTVEAYRNSFYSVTFLDIESFSVNLTTDKINISRDEKRMLNDGDILIYLTDEDRLGKMLILELDNKRSGILLFDFVTYDRDGQILLEKKEVKLRASYIFDFDKGIIPEKIEGVELWWHNMDDMEMYLVPWTPTKLGKYPLAKMN
ncbi:MAG TPA: hypothetical protein PLM80_00070 [Mesotoga sp.]|jgi:hypothetical protein|nr:hypothetical protein [Mesotoga sp.]MDI9375792.1 hypothetical protein [Thermotogota bacterium]NLX34450.1 hypothetical protein [Thermotogaceae bacterium]MDD4040243.1 hypothetical protein [Mesotoga sp.]MDD4478777.1 hypothetical protein [Mesotoga sp.]